VHPSGCDVADCPHWQDERTWHPAGVHLSRPLPTINIKLLSEFSRPKCPTPGQSFYNWLLRPGIFSGRFSGLSRLKPGRHLKRPQQKIEDALPPFLSFGLTAIGTTCCNRRLNGLSDPSLAAKSVDQIPVDSNLWA
jgi:hypothetical protein